MRSDLNLSTFSSGAFLRMGIFTARSSSVSGSLPMYAKALGHHVEKHLGS